MMLQFFMVQIHFKHTLHIKSNTNLLAIFNTGLLCYCSNKLQLNCSRNVLRAIFPGQLVTLKLALNQEVVDRSTKLLLLVRGYIKNSAYSLCKLRRYWKLSKWSLENVGVSYNVLSQNKSVCQLFLYNVNFKYPTIYYFKLLKFPAGFSFNVLVKSCQCDSILQSTTILIKKCNISDQTIQRLLTVG